MAHITFTGSAATGKHIMRSAAGTLKKITLELGGNDPALVLPDADLEAAAPAIFRAAMLNSGQVCVAVKRAYVHASRHDELVDRLAAVDKLLDRAPFLLGDDFSFAECIAGPWVQRFFVTLSGAVSGSSRRRRSHHLPRRPYFRGIDFEGDVLRAFDALPGWMRAVRDRASCQESICPEGEMLDAAKRYYVSYLSPGATGRL